MITVLSLRVRSFDLDHLDIFWDVNDTPERLDRFQVYVERSVDGPAGPWKQLAGPLSGITTNFRDPTPNLLHSWRQHSYRLRVVDADSGEELVTEGVRQEAEPDLIALEARRRFELVMAEFAGRKVLVYPAITSGFRCPSCWEANNQHGYALGRQSTHNCLTCYDSTFVAGYNTPILANMQIDPSPATVVRSDTFERTPQDTSGRLSAFPPLKPKDMIIEGENIRWEVQDVSTTRKGRAVVHQTPILHRIPKGDIRYRVPVNLDLLTEFTPERERSRPMSESNLEDQQQEPLSYFLDRLIG